MEKNCNLNYKKIIGAIKLGLMTGVFTVQQVNSENSNRFYINQINGSNGFEIVGIRPASDNNYSFNLAGPFDFNLDGKDDFLISSYSRTFGRDDRFNILFGQSQNFTHPFNLQSLDGNNGTSLQSIGEPSFRRVSPSRIGDINNDGYEDFAIRVNGEESLAIFNQQAPFDAVTEIEELPTQGTLSARRGDTGELLTFKEIGDINGDGFNDYSIMDPSYQEQVLSCYSGYYTPSWSGAHYIFLGSSNPLPQHIDLNDLDNGTTNSHRITGSNSPLGGQGLESLFDAKNLGDINGDGFDDIGLVSDGSDGCPGYYYDYGAYGGSSYIVFGGNNLQSLPSSTQSISAKQGVILNVNSDPLSNIKLFYAGDINADQIDDIGFCHTRQTCGVVFGQSDGLTHEIDIQTLNGSNGFLMSFPASYPFTSAAIDKSKRFDFNGDGIEDLAFTYFNQRDSNQDRLDEVTIVFGSTKPFMPVYDLPHISASNGLIISLPPINSGNNANTRSIDAGDINHDGYSDVFILATDPSAGVYSWVVYGNDAIFESGFEVKLVSKYTDETED